MKCGHNIQNTIISWYFKITNKKKKNQLDDWDPENKSTANKTHEKCVSAVSQIYSVYFFISAFDSRHRIYFCIVL